MPLPTIFWRCDSCNGLGMIPDGGAICICPDSVPWIAAGFVVVVIILAWIYIPSGWVS